MTGLASPYIPNEKRASLRFSRKGRSLFLVSACKGLRRRSASAYAAGKKTVRPAFLPAASIGFANQWKYSTSKPMISPSS